MARLTIPDEPTSADFVVATEQSVFPFPFAIFEKANLRVTVNGADLSQSAFTFAGTLLDGGGYQGGAVTLNTPAGPGAVRVWRRIKPVRPSNFASQTSVPVRSVDMEFNKVVAQQQDVMLAMRDVQAGVIDPDVLTEAVEAAVGPATEGKADTDGGNIPDDQAAGFRQAIKAAPDQFVRGAPRNTIDKLVERVSVKDFGAFGDGASHLLSATTTFRGVNTTGYTLAQWQVFFPSATVLTQEIDYLAHVEAINRSATDSAPTEIYVPSGKYRMGDGGLIVSTHGTTIRGDGPSATIWLSSKVSGDIFTFKDMAAGGIHNGTIAPLINRTGGAAVRFDNGHNLVSRDMKFDPGVWHGGAADAEHWSAYDMTAGADQYLYSVEHHEMNNVRFGFRIGETGALVQDVWIGKGTCVARLGGLKAYNVGGLFIYNMPGFLRCRWGIQVIPGAGQTVSGMMINGVLLDTCENHGLSIQPTGGGSVVDFQISNLWASSSGVNVAGGAASLSACGIYIDGTGGAIHGGIINGPRCIANVTHGIQVISASEITISNPQCTYNSVRSPGSFHGIMIDAGATNVNVLGGFSGPTGKFKRQGLPTTQAYGLMIYTGAVNVNVVSVNVNGNLQPGIFNGGTNCFVLQPGEALGVRRAPIPKVSIATGGSAGYGPISLGGYEPYVGFNCYYDTDIAGWRYQNVGPASALIVKTEGLIYTRFPTNAGGADAVISGIVSTGPVATA